MQAQAWIRGVPGMWRELERDLERQLGAAEAEAISRILVADVRAAVHLRGFPRHVYFEDAVPAADPAIPDDECRDFVKAVSVTRALLSRGQLDPLTSERVRATHRCMGLPVTTTHAEWEWIGRCDGLRADIMASLRDAQAGLQAAANDHLLAMYRFVRPRGVPRHVYYRA